MEAPHAAGPRPAGARRRWFWRPLGKRRPSPEPTPSRTALAARPPTPPGLALAPRDIGPGPLWRCLAELEGGPVDGAARVAAAAAHLAGLLPPLPPERWRAAILGPLRRADVLVGGGLAAPFTDDEDALVLAAIHLTQARDPAAACAASTCLGRRVGIEAALRYYDVEPPAPWPARRTCLTSPALAWAQLDRAYHRSAPQVLALEQRRGGPALDHWCLTVEMGQTREALGTVALRRVTLFMCTASGQRAVVVPLLAQTLRTQPSCRLPPPRFAARGQRDFVRREPEGFLPRQDIADSGEPPPPR